MLDVLEALEHHRLCEDALNAQEEGLLLFDGMTPALEDHALSAAEDPVLLPSFDYCHHLVVLLSTFGTRVNCFFDNHFFMLPQLILSFNILLSLDVDHVLINLSLFNGSKILPLSLLGHELR